MVSYIIQSLSSYITGQLDASGLKKSSPPFNYNLCRHFRDSCINLTWSTELLKCILGLTEWIICLYRRSRVTVESLVVLARAGATSF